MQNGHKTLEPAPGRNGSISAHACRLQILGSEARTRLSPYSPMIMKLSQSHPRKSTVRSAATCHTKSLQQVRRRRMEVV
jgi:hypothetical protein